MLQGCQMEFKESVGTFKKYLILIIFFVKFVLCRRKIYYYKNLLIAINIRKRYLKQT
jgi:hypothetical protein